MGVCAVVEGAVDGGHLRVRPGQEVGSKCGGHSGKTRCQLWTGSRFLLRLL